ncbi:nitrite reductase small subunit NirD [Colwellia sp. MEBiC06753]
MTLNNNWITVCHVDDLIDNAGVCALVNENTNHQIAIFSVPKQPERVFAIDNFDPLGQANVLYRGITGCASGEPVVASPLYKQQYSLKSGRCMQEEVSINAYPTRIENQAVQVLLAGK